MIGFARFLGAQKTFYDIKSKDEVISFLNTIIKDITVDPDKKWITTWNDYGEIKYFFRWFHNYKLINSNFRVDVSNTAIVAKSPKNNPLAVPGLITLVIPIFLLFFL